MNIPKTIPLGRIDDLRNRPDADRIAVCPGRGAFDEYRVKRYASRAALESFLRNPGQWYAVRKNRVPQSLVCWPAFEQAS